MDMDTMMMDTGMEIIMVMMMVNGMEIGTEITIIQLPSIYITDIFQLQCMLQLYIMESIMKVNM